MVYRITLSMITLVIFFTLGGFASLMFLYQQHYRWFKITFSILVALLIIVPILFPEAFGLLSDKEMLQIAKVEFLKSH